MNKIYKVVFNKSTGTFTAVTEFAKAKGKSSATTVDQSAETSSYTHKAYSLMATAFGAVLLNVPFIAGGALLPVSEAVAAVCHTVQGDGTASANGASASDRTSLACGVNATTNDVNATTNNRLNNVAVGFNARTMTGEATAIGSNAVSNGSGTFAGGYNASAGGAWSIAIGGHSQAIDGGATVNGYAAVASKDSTAIG
ncbi:ESPR-type extended signal peptide-containing protein [Moraxella sp.]|uniref:ESPR-type extended signal peptide-containing protein n=1 Tax=Moraxella sp. TaxID=479 RepID=UPI00262A10C0|nr:ESPR-type extended signal peptide-containing protein [Moraxella sp.]MCP3897077.1 hypothetical protein [Moraxella sp.]